MGGVTIGNSNNPNELGIDTNRQALVALNQDATKSGYVWVMSASDEGDYTGAPLLLNPETDADYRLRIGQDSKLFDEPWSGAAVNSGLWATNLTTFTVAVATAFLKLNSGGVTTASAVARVNTYETFSIENGAPLYIEVPVQLQAANFGIANTGWEIGWFLATGITTPTDGVYLKMSTVGVLTLTWNVNGVETNSTAIDPTNVALGMAVNNTWKLGLEVDSDQAKLWINDILAATVPRPAAASGASISGALPLTARLFNAASPPATATQLRLGRVTVGRMGWTPTLSPVDQLAFQGMGAYQGQSGGTAGQTANHANSAAPASATLSNTAAGYTTLGGQFQFAAVAGAETDYALFAYQVPVVAAGSWNKGVLVKRVTIDLFNTVVAVATTPTVFQWTIAVGATAVSLATAEAVAARAPRRVEVGVQSFAIGAAVGAQAQRLDLDLSAAPLLCEAGSFIHLILKMPIGTATATEIFRGTATILAQNVP
jgi:hypothetical protein